MVRYALKLSNANAVSDLSKFPVNRVLFVLRFLPVKRDGIYGDYLAQSSTMNIAGSLIHEVSVKPKSISITGMTTVLFTTFKGNQQVFSRNNISREINIVNYYRLWLELHCFPSPQKTNNQQSIPDKWQNGFLLGRIPSLKPLLLKILKRKFNMNTTAQQKKGLLVGKIHLK